MLFLRKKPVRLVSTLVVAAYLIGASTHAGVAREPSPLEQHPTQMGGFETANMLPQRGLKFTIGLNQTNPGSNPGTGNQTYYVGADYGLTNRLTFGFWGETYEDPPLTPVLGTAPDVGIDTIALSAKYKVYDSRRLDVAVKASAEFYRFDTALFAVNSENVIGSLQVPITYNQSRRMQYHLTPGVSILPDTQGGNQFYGTIPYVGAGFSFRFSQRWAAYGSVKVPFGANGNNITSTRGFENVPVWSVGGQFNVTPKTALDLYLTNAMGSTPTTSILTFFPEGNELLIGARLSWTPGQAEIYRPSYFRLRDLTPRQRSLQQNGFTLASVDTFDPGTVAVRTWGGTSGSRGAGFVFAPEHQLQFEGYFEDYANDGTVPAALLPTNPDGRYMVGGKIQFLDHNLKLPFSLSGRILGGRNVDLSAPGNGTLLLEAIAGTKPTDRLALTGALKLATFGGVEIFGLGLGANYELRPGLELIGEVTPTQNGNGTVWAVGARYNSDQYGLSVDATATNAIGYNSLGSMVTQSDPKFSVSVTKRLDLSGWRGWISD